MGRYILYDILIRIKDFFMSLYMGKPGVDPNIIITSSPETLSDMKATPRPVSTVFDLSSDWMVSDGAPVALATFFHEYIGGAVNSQYLSFNAGGVPIYPIPSFDSTTNTYVIDMVEELSGESYPSGMIPHKYPGYAWRLWDTYRWYRIIGTSYPTELDGAVLRRYTFKLRAVDVLSGDIRIGSGDVLIGGTSLNSQRFLNVVPFGAPSHGIALGYLGTVQLEFNNPTIGSLMLTQEGVFKDVAGAVLPLFPSNTSLYKGVTAAYSEQVYTIGTAPNSITLPNSGDEIYLVMVTTHCSGTDVDNTFVINGSAFIMANGVVATINVALFTWSQEFDGGAYYADASINNYTITCLTGLLTTHTIVKIQYISIGTLL